MTRVSVPAAQRLRLRASTARKTTELMKYPFRLSCLAAVATLVFGCSSDGVSRPPPTVVRVVDAAPNFGVLDFLRVARTEVSLDFGEGQNLAFDSGPYDFNVLSSVPGVTSPQNVASVSFDVSDKNENTFVLTQSAGNVEILVVPQPLPDAGTTTARLILIHAAALEARFDAYFEPVGTDLSTVTSFGSASFRESVVAEGIEGGNYVLTLTAPNDVGVVRYQSESITVLAGSSNVAVIADEGNRGTSDFGVIYLDTIGGHLRAPGEPSALRAVSGIGDMAARDLYLDGDYSAPFISGATFGTLTDYASISPGLHVLTVTPLGNPGVVEDTLNISLTPGRLFTTVLGGNTTDGLVQSLTIEDHRALKGAAQLQIFNASDQFDSLSYYIVDPGTDISTVIPTALLSGDADYFNFFLAPRDYELSIRDPVGGATVSGPTTISLTEGGLFGLIAVDAAGGSTVDATFFEQTF